MQIVSTMVMKSFQHFEVSSIITPRLQMGKLWGNCGIVRSLVNSYMSKVTW